jgi:hypothetical protein
VDKSISPANSIAEFVQHGPKLAVKSRRLMQPSCSRTGMCHAHGLGTSSNLFRINTFAGALFPIFQPGATAVGVELSHEVDVWLRRKQREGLLATLKIEE